jgi:hypothetical protein
MANPASAASGPAPALVRALHRLLRPLVRLLLQQQITYPYLADLLKHVYVELANEEFALAEKRQTTSRVSLLTGIHRKDVKRLRETPSGADTAPAVVSLGAQLVARWTGVDAYTDATGHPRPLPRAGAAPSFESLVASVSKDIRARAVLDEWLRLGVASLDAENRVRLEVEAFVPERGFDEKAFYFGRNLQDHVAAAAHNLSGGHPPFLERSVYYDQLSAESVRELRELAERSGMEALQLVNRRALTLQTRDAAREDARQRVNFGIYCFDAEAPDPDASGSDDE